MPSVNQYLRYIGQTESRIEKLTSSIAVLRDQKKTAPKTKQVSISNKLKLAQEELKESKAKLKEHKANMSAAKKEEKNVVAKAPKKAGRPAKATVTKSPAIKAGRPAKAKVSVAKATSKAGRPAKTTSKTLNVEEISIALELLSIKMDALAALISTGQPKNLSTAQLRVMRRGL